VAPLLVSKGDNDKPAALRVLLLACTISPPESLVTLLSIALPLLVQCMWVAADGTPSPPQKELSALSHASFTALAKRSPNEFRAAVASFSPESRSRMEAAIRESATGSVATPTIAAKAAAEKPKIALKMDFSSFGAK